MSRRGGIRAVGLFVACVLALVACGGDDDGDEESGDNTTTEASTDDTEPTTTTTAAPATPTEQAIAAYNRMWEEEFIALNPPNPAHPGLGQVLTGPAHQAILDVIVQAENDGIRVQDGRMETHPVPVSETAEKVTLRDCSVEHGSDVNLGTGATVASGPYEPRSRVVDVVLINGLWLVSSIQTFPEEPCTPG